MTHASLLALPAAAAAWHWLLAAEGASLHATPAWPAHCLLTQPVLGLLQCVLLQHLGAAGPMLRLAACICPASMQYKGQLAIL
jgi:hypothetical protein